MKTIVLDTNVFIDNPLFLNTLRDSQVVIPFEVIRELENLKTKHDLTGKNARQTLNFLDSLRETVNSLSKGIQISENNIRVHVHPPFLNSENLSTDDIIVKIAKSLRASIITGDTAMRIIADIQGVESLKPKDFESELLVRDRSHIDLTTQEKNELFSQGHIPIPNKCFPNEFLISNQAIGRYENGHFCLLKKDIQAFGLKPRTKEQSYALNVLLDPDIPLVTLTGSAGCGKTLLAIAAAMESVIEHKVFEKIIITRPIIPMGNDLGYLPGLLSEKLQPWIQPLMDNLLFLTKGDVQSLRHLQERYIELEALTYIRGRSIPKRFFIIDEAQNLSPAEIKTIVTRMGEGSKIVFTGDLNQIDVNRSDRSSNGLSYLITKMLDQPLAAHVHLLKGERSPLATVAAEIL